jgi:hypothetical protein
MSSYPTPLTPNQLNLVAQQATIAALGLTLQSPANPADPAYAAVRVGWQQVGQPAFKVTEDVVFLRCAEDDDQYNRVRDVSINSQEQQLMQYTRVWRVWWTLYGPNSFDNARIVRSALFSQAVHDIFSSAQLYFVTNPSAPQRVPEQKDGQWWERVDFSARFNEFVTETPPVTYADSVVVTLENSSGVIATIPVPPEA